MRVACLALALAAAPVAAQSLPALTPCCPNTVATVDPITGDTTVVAEVGTQTDWFVGTVGSVAIDVVGQRAFLIRNFRLTTANLVTGEVVEGTSSFAFVQLAGYDVARDRLLAVATEVEAVGAATLYTNYLAAYRPATQDTVRIARIGQALIPGGPGSPGDTFASVSGPAVADGGSLFTIRNGRLLRVDLATGALTEGPAETGLGELLGYDAAADALYRLGRVTTVTDSSQTFTGVVTRQTTGGVPDTLATVTRATVFNNGGVEGDLYVASTGVAVYDAVSDRVVLNRNGSYLVVELGSGRVRTGPAAAAGVVGGALSARVVSADDAPGDAPALRAVPNPTRGMVRVAVGTHASARVEVLDALGRRVALLADGPTAGDVTWDASRVPPGVYRVRVVADGRAASVPVTVAR